MATVCILIVTAGCGTTPEHPEGRAVLKAEADEAIAVFKRQDPEIQKFFDKSYGYAVLPKVFKGAFFAGGAYGKGEVYERG
jgi:lipid-binding SYLF domain-containing protein